MLNIAYYASRQDVRRITNKLCVRAPAIHYTTCQCTKSIPNKLYVMRRREQCHLLLNATPRLYNIVLLYINTLGDDEEVR